MMRKIGGPINNWFRSFSYSLSSSLNEDNNNSYENLSSVHVIKYTSTSISNHTIMRGRLGREKMTDVRY